MGYESEAYKVLTTPESFQSVVEGLEKEADAHGRGRQTG